MYSDLPAALARAKQASTLPDARIDETYVNELLELSKGALPARTAEYRPFIVAAMLLEQDPNTQRLTETKGTKFDNLQRTIDSLYRQQNRIDSGLGLTVPDGWVSRPSSCDTCDAGADDAQTSGTLTRYSPVRVSTGLVF